MLLGYTVNDSFMGIIKWTLHEISLCSRITPCRVKCGHCSCSVSQSCLTLFNPWTEAHQASLSFSTSWSLLKLMSIESVMPYKCPVFCRLLLLPPSIFPSIRVFSKEAALGIRWPKYWSFSISISPFNAYSGLISFRIDRFDLLAVEGSLLQHDNSKASILRLSAFFMVQLWRPYMTTGNIIALTVWTFLAK